MYHKQGTTMKVQIKSGGVLRIDKGKCIVLSSESYMLNRDYYQGYCKERTFVFDFEEINYSTRYIITGLFWPKYHIRDHQKLFLHIFSENLGSNNESEDDNISEF